MVEETELSPALQQAIRELLSAGKIRQDEDIFFNISQMEQKQPPQQKPPQKKPPKPQDPNKPQLPPVTHNQILTKELLDIVIGDANLINMGLFLGHRVEKTVDLLYGKPVRVMDLRPGAVMGVTKDDEMLISTDAFNYIIKYYNSEEKDVKYWEMVYIIGHEFLHLLTQTKDKHPYAMPLDEAIVPIIELEFYNYRDGALNPHMVDHAEFNFDRMSHKFYGIPRPGYPPITFNFFDQLVGFYAVDPAGFFQTMKDYSSVRTYKEKYEIIRKAYPLFTDYSIAKP